MALPYRLFLQSQLERELGEHGLFLAERLRDGGLPRLAAQLEIEALERGGLDPYGRGIGTLAHELAGPRPSRELFGWIRGLGERVGLVDGEPPEIH